MGFQALVWAQPLRTQDSGTLVEGRGRTVWGTGRGSALIFSGQETGERGGAERDKCRDGAVKSAGPFVVQRACPLLLGLPPQNP